MIPSDLAARLRTLTEASFFKTEPPIQAAARVREIQARLPDFLPGERFTATLTRAQPDGSFQAMIAGRPFTLALGTSANPGDTLEFIVTGKAQGAIVAQLAPPQSAMQAAATAERPQLSSTGRLISFLLTGQPTTQPTELAGGRALLNAPPTQGGAPLVPLLRQALSQSGLFYESHQSQWLSGKQNLANLLAQPQGQHGPARSTAEGHAGTRQTATGQPGGASGTAAADRNPPISLTTSKGDPGTPAGSRAPSADAPARPPAPPGNVPGLGTAAPVSSQPTLQASSAPQPLPAAGAPGAPHAAPQNAPAPAAAGAQAAAPSQAAQQLTQQPPAAAALAQSTSAAGNVPRGAQPASQLAQPPTAGSPLAAGGTAATQAQPPAAGAAAAAQPAPANTPLPPQAGAAPENKLSTPLQTTRGAPATTDAAAAPAARAATAAGQAAVTAGGEADAMRGAVGAASDTEASISSAARTAPVPERLMPIVQQQLDSMATQHYVVQAQAWPGQRFEWEIEDQDPQGGEDADAQTWNTTVRLSMPRLGGVEAILHLTPAGLAVRLRAADSDTAAELEASRHLLESALEAADIPLTGFVAERKDVN